MKIFLQRIAYFILSLVLIFIISIATLYLLNKEALKSYKIDSDKNTIIVGDSHIQYGINDRVTTGGVNLSQVSETFDFSYYKIQSLLKYNPNIKRVFLGFSYHNLSSYMDEYSYGKYSKEVSSRYFFILPTQLQIKLLNESKRSLPAYIREISLHGLKNAIKFVLLNDKSFSFLGYYFNDFENTQAVEASIDKRIQYQFYDENGLKDPSELNLYYLERIIEMCEANKVQLVIVNTPLHHSYEEKIPNFYKELYSTVINKYNLALINFDYMGYCNSCFIPDGDHTSKIGTFRISKELNQFMQSL